MLHHSVSCNGCVEARVSVSILLSQRGYEEAIVPCSPIKVSRGFGRTCLIHLHGLRAYSSTLKMEATYSSETSVDFQWTTLRYVPEDRTLHFYTPLFFL
jgi:hypothetical protein